MKKELDNLHLYSGIDAHQILIDGKMYHAKDMNLVHALQKLLPAILGLLDTNKSNGLQNIRNIVDALLVLYSNGGKWIKQLSEDEVENPVEDAEKMKFQYLSILGRFDLHQFIEEYCVANNYNDSEFSQLYDICNSPSEFAKKSRYIVECKRVLFIEKVLKQVYVLDTNTGIIEFLSNIETIEKHLESQENIYNLCWEVLKHNFAFLKEIFDKLSIEYVRNSLEESEKKKPELV